MLSYEEARRVGGRDQDRAPANPSRQALQKVHRLGARRLVEIPFARLAPIAREGSWMPRIASDVVSRDSEPPEATRDAHAPVMDTQHDDRHGRIHACRVGPGS